MNLRRLVALRATGGAVKWVKMCTLHCNPTPGPLKKPAFVQVEGSRGRWGCWSGALKAPLGALCMWFALTKNSRLRSSRQSKVCWPVICSTRRQLGLGGFSKASGDGWRFSSGPLRCSIASQRLSNEFQRVFHWCSKDFQRMGQEDQHWCLKSSHWSQSLFNMNSRVVCFLNLFRELLRFSIDCHKRWRKLFGFPLHPKAFPAKYVGSLLMCEFVHRWWQDFDCLL